MLMQIFPQYLAGLAIVLILTACDDFSRSSSSHSEALEALQQLKLQVETINAKLLKLQAEKRQVPESIAVRYLDQSLSITEEMFVPFVFGEAKISVPQLDAPSAFFLGTHYSIQFSETDVRVEGHELVLVERGVGGTLKFKARLPQHNLNADTAIIHLTPKAWIQAHPASLQ